MYIVPTRTDDGPEVHFENILNSKNVRIQTQVVGSKKLQISWVSE